MDAASSEGVQHSHPQFREECGKILDADKDAWVLPLVNKLLDSSFVLWKYSSVKEIESCFLILFSILARCPVSATDAQRVVVLKLGHSLGAVEGGDVQFRVRLLATLYNFFPRHRYAVLIDFVEQGLKSRDAQIVDAQLPHFESWCESWNVTSQEKRALFFKTFDVLTAVNLPKRAFVAIKTGLKGVHANEVDEDAKNRANAAVILALSLPSEYVVDELCALPAVAVLKDHERYRTTHQLLMVVLKGTVADYEKFEKEHASFFEQDFARGLQKDQLLSKMRLLSLASAAEDKPVLPFSEAATALGIAADNGVELEMWIIRAISQGLISGKLDQLSQTVKVTNVVSRSFEAKQWERAAKDVDRWILSVRKTHDLLKSEKKQ